MTDVEQVRINDLARELEVRAKAIIDLLPGYGVTEKKTHSSSIPADVAEKVRKKITEQAAAKLAAAASAKIERDLAAKAARVRPPAHPSVYVSYASGDKSWRDLIASDLNNAGIQVWYPPPGEPGTDSQLASQVIRENCQVFVIVVSFRYIDSDEIHRIEFPHIRSLVQSGERRIIFVILEPCPWESSLALPQVASVVIPNGDRTLSKETDEQVKDDLHTLAHEVRRAIQETDKSAAPPQSNEAPSETQADEKALGRPPLAQLLAAKLEISSRRGEYKAMATLISPTVALTPFHIISESGLLKEPSARIMIQCLGTSAPIPATLAASDQDLDFAVLQLASKVPFDLPPNLISTTLPLPKTKWQSYFAAPDQGKPAFIDGRLRSTEGTMYVELEVSVPFQMRGISGAPVIMEDRLVGIMSGGDESAHLLYAVSLKGVAESTRVDAIRSLLLGPFVAVPFSSLSVPLEAPPQPSSWITQETFNRFSKEALTVLSRAHRLSMDQNSPVVRTRHLLLGFREQTFNEAGPRRNSELTIFVLSHEKDLVEVLESVPPIQRAAPPPLKDPPSMSINVRSALLTAISKAGDGPIDESHLLFGVLSTVSDARVQELNKRGMTPDAVPLPPVDPSVSERQSVLAGYQSDDPSGTDLLGIRDEVRALASVLAAKDVDPPLSLGLFGDWGAGKSFFMHQLEARIRELQDDAKLASGESAHCRNIVQITFNAWNYIDCNLWASLTAEIFENLAAAIAQTRGADSPEERALVLAAASSSQEVLAEAEKKRAEAERELKQTEERLVAVQKSEADLEATLDPGEILRQALRFAMQDDQVQKHLDAAARALHIPEGVAVANEVRSEIIDLHGTTNAVILTLKNNRYLWVWIAILGLALGAGWLVPRLVFESHLVILATRTVAYLMTMSAFVAPLVNASRKAMLLVERAKASKQALVEQKRKEQTDKLNAARAQIQQKVKAARKNVDEASAKAKALNEQLEKMRADRRMADYIRQRHQSTDYTQHLGIISRVRADLRHLSTLLRAVKEESEQDTFEAGMKERQAEKDRERESKGKQPLFPRIDRIVLYIDDLDRCREVNVVEVLQAVHLLLAFPLFVVVVGVDPRWLLHSLRQNSRAFRNDEIENGAGRLLEEERHWESTPLNYLEKIFQIPFSLRPIEKKGFGNIVDTFARSKQRPEATSGEVPGPDKHEEPKASLVTVEPQTQPASSPEPKYEESPSPGASVSREQTPVNVAGAPIQPSAAQHPLGPSAVDRNPDQLQIRDWERAFMKELDEFIPTPRAGKRFLNIYRLLRASVRKNELEAFAGNEQGGGYQIATLLLAILTGYPSQATEILRVLIEEEPSGDWWGFVSSFKARMLDGSASQSKKKLKPASKSSMTTAPDAAGETPDESRTDRASWLELFERLDKVKNLVSDRPCKQFVEWAPRVARYSFQSGRVLYYQK